MKKVSAVTFFLVLMVLGQVVGAAVGTAPRISANIPFAFHAGGQLLPAGDYVFEMNPMGARAATGSLLAIRTRDGSVFLYLNAIRGDARDPDQCAVTFSKYGGTYFLSAVQNGKITSSLPKTRAEKELALTYSQGGKDGSKSVIVASSTQE